MTKHTVHTTSIMKIIMCDQTYRAYDQHYEDNNVWPNMTRCNPLHPLYGDLSVPYVPVLVTRGAVIDIGRLMRLLAEPCSIAGLLFVWCSAQFLCGTILVTLHSMVWDWLVSRANPMPFYWPSCSLPFCLLLFFLSLHAFILWVIVGLGSSDW